MTRRPSMRFAGIDLALAAVALGAGLTGSPPAYAPLVFLGAAAIWAWTRWATLSLMEPIRKLANAALALALLGVVLGGAYWIGLMVGGHL